MKSLLYITNGYPGDLYSEKMFVDPELRAMLRRFDRVVMLPTVRLPRGSGYADALPPGVSVDWSLCEDRVFSTKLLKAVYLFHPFVLRALRDLKGEARTPQQWLKGAFQAINIIRAGRVIRRVLRRHGMTPADTVLYSLWFGDPASAAARLALREGWHTVTRAHTSDLYDNRLIFRSRRLRARMLEGMDKVLTISRNGADYLRERYPASAHKIAHVPLGSIHSGGDAPPEVAGKDRDTITLATTARLDPIKCLDLLMDTLDETALRLPRLRLRWVLTGDGECMDALRAQSRRLRAPNLEVVMNGAMDNREIQHFYQTDPPDWYIMMSRSEGMPVSMGEAMSHSIPVITTDVGDIRELVDEDCAIILPAPFTADGAMRTTPASYASLIAPVISDRPRRNRMAAAARSRWEKTFDAATLSARTAEICSSLLTP